MARINKKGELRGSVRTEGLGKLQFYGEDGDTKVRSTRQESHRVDPKQLWRTIKMHNLVAVYKKLKWLVEISWEPKLAHKKKNGLPQGNPYTWFESVNMQRRGCALWPKYDDPAGCVVAPYQVTNGSLESIIVVPIDEDGYPVRSTMDDCPRARTNIRIGELVVDEKTTICQFAEAIINENEGWDWGDTLVYVRLEQKVRREAGAFEDNEYPFVIERHWLVPLEAENRPLSDVIELRYVSNVGGYVGQDESNLCGQTLRTSPVEFESEKVYGKGYCWVHLRGVLHPEDLRNDEPEMSDEELAERMAEVAKLAPEEDFLLEEETVTAPKCYRQRKREKLLPVESSTQVLVCDNKEMLAKHRSHEFVLSVMERHLAIKKVAKAKREVLYKDWGNEAPDWGM